MKKTYIIFSVLTTMVYFFTMALPGHSQSWTESPPVFIQKQTPIIIKSIAPEVLSVEAGKPVTIKVIGSNLQGITSVRIFKKTSGIVTGGQPVQTIGVTMIPPTPECRLPQCRMMELKSGTGDTGEYQLEFKSGERTVKAASLYVTSPVATRIRPGDGLAIDTVPMQEMIPAIPKSGADLTKTEANTTSKAPSTLTPERLGTTRLMKEDAKLNPQAQYFPDTVPTTRTGRNGYEWGETTPVARTTERVLTPKDGDIWRTGQSYNIQWVFKIEGGGGRQAIDLTSGKEINVDLINTNGQKIMDIVNGVGLQSYKWTVPNTLVGGIYRIAVTVASPNVPHVARSSAFSVSSNVPVTVRNWSQYDVNQVWLRCEPNGMPNLVIPDLTEPLPIPNKDGATAPNYDTSKVIEVPQGTVCNLDYVQERIPVRPSVLCPGPLSTSVFRAGMERIPGSTILRETIIIFDHDECSILKNWARMEQIVRTSDDKVYRYLIFDAAGSAPPSKNPILLEELLVQGYKAYNSGEFVGKYEPYSASK